MKWRFWKLAPRKAKRTRYVSWYQEPRLNKPREYLMREPDSQLYGKGEGFMYTPFLSEAHRFDTAEEALKATPSYDGSSGIAKRAGILVVLD